MCEISTMAKAMARATCKLCVWKTQDTLKPYKILGLHSKQLGCSLGEEVLNGMSSDGTVRSWGTQFFRNYSKYCHWAPPPVSQLTPYTQQCPATKNDCSQLKYPRWSKIKHSNLWFLRFAQPLVANKYSNKNIGKGGKLAQRVRGARLFLQRNQGWAQYPE